MLIVVTFIPDRKSSEIVGDHPFYEKFENHRSTRVYEVVENWMYNTCSGTHNEVGRQCVFICINNFKSSVWNTSCPVTYYFYSSSGGRRSAITDLLITSRHPFRSFYILNDSAVLRPVHSLMLSSHRIL